MAVKFGQDVVNGECVGGEYFTGTLHKYSDGTQQGPDFYSRISEDDIRKQAIDYYNERGGKTVWPDGLELRFPR